MIFNNIAGVEKIKKTVADNSEDHNLQINF